MTIEITWDPLPSPEVEALPETVRDRMDCLFPLLKTGPGKIIEEIRELVRQYPGVDCFRNWLCSCLRLLGKNVEALAVCEATFLDFPDYLFARTTLAELLLETGDIDKAERLLGGTAAMLPSAVWPDRKLFHGSEVRHWLFLHGKLCLCKGDINGARICSDALHKLETRSTAAKELDRLLQPDNSSSYQLLGGLRKMQSLFAGQPKRKGRGPKAPRTTPPSEPELFPDE